MAMLDEMVLEALAARGWRKSRLVAAMGYQDQARGLKRLEAALRGEATADCFARLREALGFTAAQLDAALRETRARRAEEQTRLDEALRRANFQPYVYVQTGEIDPPNPKAAAILAPRIKVIALDAEVLRLPRMAQLARVAEIVREHYHANVGRCLLFGEITGYLFCLAYDETIELSIEGSLLGLSATPPDLPAPVAPRAVSGGLFALGM